MKLSANGVRYCICSDCRKLLRRKRLRATRLAGLCASYCRELWPGGPRAPFSELLHESADSFQGDYGDRQVGGANGHFA